MTTTPGTALETSRAVRVRESAGGRAQRWLAWVMWTVSLAAAAAVVSSLTGSPAVDVVEGLGWVVGVMAVATIGVQVVSKRRGLVQGWLLLVFAVIWSAGLYAYHLIDVPGADGSGLGSARVLIAVGDASYALGVSVLLLLMLLIPHGRLLAPRWRPLLWVLGVSTTFWTWQSVKTGLNVVDVEAWLDRSTWLYNDGVAQTVGDEVILGMGIVLGAVMLALFARYMWERFQSVSGEERQQVKWVFFGCTGVFAWFAISLPKPDGGWLVILQRLFPGWAFVLLAVGFGMALFKYRLWEIDLVVRRSLVYGVLWLIIAGVYVGVAAGLGLAAGARFPVGVAIGITAMATIVFQPARRWLERVADRWVFGRKESPVDALQTLGEGVADLHRPQDIAAHLTKTGASALGLGWVAVEVDGSIRAEQGERTDEPVTVLPLAWGSENFGVLRCQPKRGYILRDEDVALLEALAGQAALAISHARLASRIVYAQEQERRRIERNIHDGAQQDLATLMAQIAVARAKSNGDPAIVEMLNRLQGDARRILAEIRELAQGIHPSVLRDGGLMVAIEDRCARLPIEVTLTGARSLEGRRLPAELEAAAFFLVAEAMTNTLKHSGSSTIDIALEADERTLRIEVSDQGVGFDPRGASQGSGLAGLSDRIRALGGELEVSSEPGRGSVVSASLPITSDAGSAS